MNNIPEKLRQELANDPYMKRCARANDDCDGRITFEHALMYAGRQVQRRFAIIPLCVYHHLGPGLDKNINRQIALSRASDVDLSDFPKATWRLLKPYKITA